MNYEETLSYLFDRLPVFQRVGAPAYRKDLRNTLALARMCENPELEFKSIHIAGTNGKGSTAHAIASSLQSCGYKTGLMTSPHYKDFRERIRVNGQMVSKVFVQDWVERHQSRFEEIEPSFFELTVIMGFSYFREQQVDIAVIETGMGGRLDSTNILTPELSIITPISFDHKAFLGETLEEIALEKGGIIKQGIPVVVAANNTSVLPVLRSISETRKAPLHQVIISNENIQSDIKGAYQQDNLATAIKACEVLKDIGWKLNDNCVRDGLKSIVKNTGIQGRWQVLQKNPLIIADSAHNPHGISKVIESVQALEYDQLHIVIGMVSEKEVDEVLDLLPLKAQYYFCQAKVIRALSCDLLAIEANQKGLLGECFGSVIAAFTSAKHAARKNDLILITGSVFVVAEVI